MWLVLGRRDRPLPPGSHTSTLESQSPGQGALGTRGRTPGWVEDACCGQTGPALGKPTPELSEGFRLMRRKNLFQNQTILSFLIHHQKGVSTSLLPNQTASGHYWGSSPGTCPPRALAAPLISHKLRCPGPASPLWHLLGLTRTQDTKLDVPSSWGAGSCPPGRPSGRPHQGNHTATRQWGENFPGSGNKTTQNRSTLLPRACCRALLMRSTRRCASVARAAVGTHRTRGATGGLNNLPGASSLRPGEWPHHGSTRYRGFQTQAHRAFRPGLGPARCPRAPHLAGVP